MGDGTTREGSLPGRLAEAWREIARSIVGQDEAVDLVLAALLCEGHLLLEGPPGVGKTLLARSAATVLELAWSRIQFTPDLMPADILGSGIIERRGEDYALRFERGPVFANVILADEVNRASPKTQSALLEAMEERAVTARGVTHALPRPFVVIATQNPLEMEGTYPLPEAQVDRFLFKAILRQPPLEELVRIAGLGAGRTGPGEGARLPRGELAALQEALRGVITPPELVELAARLVLATQPERPDSPARTRALVRWGAGPRGVQALVLGARAAALLDGRLHAGLADLDRFLLPALRHRVQLNYEGLSEGVSVEELLAEARDAALAALGSRRAEAPLPPAAGPAARNET